MSVVRSENGIGIVLGPPGEAGASNTFTAEINAGQYTFHEWPDTFLALGLETGEPVFLSLDEAEQLARWLCERLSDRGRLVGGRV